VRFRRYIAATTGKFPQDIVGLGYSIQQVALTLAHTMIQTHRKSQRDVATLTAALLGESACRRASARTRARGGRLEVGVGGEVCMENVDSEDDDWASANSGRGKRKGLVTWNHTP
jgi:hypothetical protein